MSFQPIPALGFTKISGQRNPPDDDTEYQIQLKNGWVDEKNRYTARQLVWIHDGSSGDIVAIKKV